MKAGRILVVDDKDTARALVKRVLAPRGYEVLEAPGVHEALDLLARESVDMVLSDLRMPGCDGIEGIPRVRAIDPDLPIAIITAFATVDSAIEAIRAGAFDYLQKPLDPSALEVCVARAVAHRRLIEENKSLKEKLSGTRPEPRLIVRSASMIELLRLVERVAPTDVPVLITGDSGCGKELIARRIHALSRRSAKPFLTLNCAAIPETLLESELFGHEKGVYSGANVAREGFFAEAEGGTLFLDEIGDMSLALQPKLLRVLQEGEYYRLGEHTPRRTDARIVCATNLDLAKQVELGKFRADLYYRIDHARIRIPPLRERPEDIAPLAEYFLGRARTRFGVITSVIAPDAMRALLAYPWPGNVRELENMVERACLAASGIEITASDLPAELSGARAAGPRELSGELLPYREAREAFEKAYFRAVLARAGENVAVAAKLAKLHRATLYEKLTRYDIVKQG